MQGTLNEIDIRSILQLIELGQRTGELLVEAQSPYTNILSGDASTKGLTFGRPYPESRVKEALDHLVCLLSERTNCYAANSGGSLSRLRDYLRRYKADTALDNLELPSISAINAPEYAIVGAIRKPRSDTRPRT
jgi:twitching motility two-component system response regulator PilG